MPGLDLSSLNSQELRNILEAAKSRNQTDLTQEVLSELRSRRTRPPGVPWRVGVRDDDEARPEVWWEDLKQEAEVVEPPEPSKAPVLLGVTAAVLLSAGVGWWLSPRGQGQSEAPVASIEAPPRAMAALAPDAQSAPAQDFSRHVETAAPPVHAPEEAAAPAEAAAAPPPAAVKVARAEPVEPRPTAPQPALARAAKVEPALRAHVAPPVKIAKAEPAVRAPVASPSPTAARPEPVKVATAEPAAKTPVKPKTKSCQSEPTPADRTICTYPTLAAQHRRMQEAYDRAISAGADPAMIDRDQASFRIRRDGVWNRDTLAKLYDRRIRELNAAAARASTTPTT